MARMPCRNFGTKQKVANVLVEMNGAKPVRIERADGSFLTFDENGEVLII